MATYNHDTNLFTLEEGEQNFAIPETIEGGPTPANANVLGNALNNILTGNGTNNSLAGGAGNDTLIGGNGADALDGGDDFDTASYENAGAAVKIDFFDLTKNTGDAQGDTYSSIEAITGSAFDDTITGSGDVGMLFIGGGGRDSITGGGGNDTIEGGPGGDFLYGGAGIDTLSYAHSAEGVIVTLNGTDGSSGSGGNTGDGKSDLIIGFEYLIGSAFKDTLDGNKADNSIDGGAGNDILAGKDGDDTLFGGLGADDMNGGKGDDTFYVDDPGDYVREAAGEGRDMIVTTISYSLTIQEVEILRAAEGTAALRLTGNALANIISGNDGANVLNGMGGADQMIGGAGNDIYYVDNAGDKVTEEETEGTSDLIYSSVSYTLADYVEHLYATGSSAISLTGNGLNNVIKGNSGANRINGGAGDDTIDGGSGKDALTGGSGRDTFVFSTKASSSNYDKIADYSVTSDSIYIDNKYFTKLGLGSLTSPKKLSSKYFTTGTKAKDKYDHLIYDKVHGGNLYYDPDGTGSAKQVLIATFSNKPSLKYSEFFVI